MTKAELDLSGSLSDWVAGLPPYQQETVQGMLNRHDAAEAAQLWLDAAGAAHTAQFGALRIATRIFYDRLLEELQTLLCSTEMYASERADLMRQAQTGKATLIAGITTALAPQLGAAAVVIGPTVALTLALVGRASRSATCEALTEYRRARAEAAEDDAPTPPAGGSAHEGGS